MDLVWFSLDLSLDLGLGLGLGLILGLGLVLVLVCFGFGLVLVLVLGSLFIPGSPLVSWTTIISVTPLALQASTKSFTMCPPVGIIDVGGWCWLRMERKS